MSKIYFRSFWSERKDYAFVLTHDVETAEGQKYVTILADLKEIIAVNTNDTIREFITQEMLYGNLTSTLGDDDQLLESGTIDSLGIMTLLSFLEDKFSLQISSEDLVPENFASISIIAALVERLTNE